jgi:putative intracellular protease/amidase
MHSKVNEINSYVHIYGAPVKGKIMMVTSSPAVSSQTGWPIGFWAAELTHPLHVFQSAGYEVEIASTAGGKIEMDAYSNPKDASGYSAHDVISLGYLQLEWFNQMLEQTKKVAEIDPDHYDAVFLVGGQGPMYTFRGNQVLETLFAGFLESGKPSAVVCHASCLLLEAKGSDGKLLVDGKTWTGFANAEEAYADESVGQKIQPYWIEEEARKLPNTHFKAAAAFSSYAIEDGNLITGQQQNSGAAVATLVVQQLSGPVTLKD